MGIREKIKRLQQQGLTEPEARQKVREDEIEDRELEKIKVRRQPPDARTRAELRKDLESADQEARRKRAGGSPRTAREKKQRENFIDLHGQDD